MEEITEGKPRPSPVLTKIDIKTGKAPAWRSHIFETGLPEELPPTTLNCATFITQSGSAELWQPLKKLKELPLFPLGAVRRGPACLRFADTLMDRRKANGLKCRADF